MFKPILDYVALEPIAQTMSKGGIVLPSTLATSEFAKVIGVGEGVYQNGVLIKPTVKVNDVVAFSRGVFTQKEIDGKQILIGKENAIFGIIK